MQPPGSTRAKTGKRHVNETERPQARGSSRRNRLILGFLDQGIVSATGLLTFVAAAQFLSPNDLGYFSFGVATCLLIVSLSRAICGEPLLVRSVRPLTGRPYVYRDSRSMVALAIILGLVASILCAVIALLSPTPNMPLLGAAIAAPGLVLQDSLRFCFIALQRTRSLILNDFATLVFGAAAIVVTGLVTKDSFIMVASWGLASFAVGFLTLLWNGFVPSFGTSISWLMTTWRSSSAFFTENAMGALAGYTIIVILTVFVAPAEVAAFRATLVVYGISSLVINFLRTQVLRELHIGMLGSVRGLIVTSMKLSIPVAITIVTMLVILLLIPQALGTSLLHETWILVGALLVPGAINRFFAGLSIVPTITLRIQGITWKATMIKICILFVSLGLGPVGALYAGAAGALMADAIAYALTAILLFILSVRKAKSLKHPLISAK